MNCSLIFVVFAMVMFVAVSGQNYYFSSFGGLPAGADPFAQQTRDPRQNRGPVVFPMAPPSSDETSGVVVGASGYGFVPPNSNQAFTAKIFGQSRYF